MTEDELYDLLTDIESTVSVEQKPVRLEKTAAAVPVGEHGRASLLIAAGEHWQMRGEYDEARRCFLEAQADGGETIADPVANLHSLALEEGDDEAAAQHVQSLRDMAKRDELTSAACLYVGETLESHGRLREAHRWFTIPLTRSDDDEDLDYYCLVGRLRVRTELGLPTDRFDLLALEQRESRRRDASASG